MKQPITTEAIQAILDYIDEGAPDLEVIKAELGEIVLRSTGEYFETPPKLPEGPPCREYRETFFLGLIETEESKRLTKEWRAHAMTIAHNEDKELDY